MLLLFDSALHADANAERLKETAADIRTGGVARAAREDPSERFGVGDAVGYSGEGPLLGVSRQTSSRAPCAR